MIHIAFIRKNHATHNLTHMGQVMHNINKLSKLRINTIHSSIQNRK